MQVETLQTLKMRRRISPRFSFEQICEEIEYVYCAFFNRHGRWPAKILLPAESFEALKDTRLPLPDGGVSSITALKWLSDMTRVKMAASDALDGVILAMDSAGMVIVEMPQS